MPYYAVQKLREHMRVIENQTKIVNENNFEETHDRIILRTIELTYNFLEICFSVSPYSALKRYGQRLLMPLIEEVHQATDVLSLKTSVNHLQNFIQENNDDLSDFNYNSFAVNYSYFTSLQHYLNNRTEAYNVLFYDCSNEVIQGKLHGIDINVTTYAIYARRTPNYDLNLDNIISGIGINSRITNNAFDVMILNPILEQQAHMTGINNNIIEQREFTQLKNATKYLRNNGLLQMIIPFFRINRELAFYIAKNYRNISIIHVNEWLCEISGIKAIKTDGSSLDSEAYLRLLEYYKIYNTSNESVNHYELPLHALEIESFRGSNISDAALAKVLASSDCYEHINDSDYARATTHHPLLPFNTGQIGLILASGCLDGIIDEDEEHCHLIKGRVYQKEKMVQQEDSSVTYHFNQVQINALTPDGKFISIQ